MNSPLLEKSLDFATQIVIFYEEFSKSKKDTTIAKQLLRSATSIGANLHEAQYAQGTKDFISKLEIALKECNETEYWLELLFETGYIPEDDYKKIQNEAGSIRRMLISSVATVKKNQ